MIKKKALDIKLFLKALKIGQKLSSSQANFCSTKHHRTIFKNYSKKLFFRTVFKTNYQIGPYLFFFWLCIFSFPHFSPSVCIFFYYSIVNTVTTTV